MNDNQEDPAGLRAALTDLGAMLRTKNTAIVDAFAVNGVLVGSDAGEIARGADEIRDFFATFFAQPMRASWEWDRVDMQQDGQIAWLFAEGSVVITADTGERRLPYRLSAVLEAAGDGWKWRLFHGSEPA